MDMPLYFAALNTHPAINTDILIKTIPRPPCRIDQLFYMVNYLKTYTLLCVIVVFSSPEDNVLKWDFVMAHCPSSICLCVHPSTISLNIWLLNALLCDNDMTISSVWLSHSFLSSGSYNHLWRFALIRHSTTLFI